MPRKTLAPVLAIARAVSTPIPEEQPVIRKTWPLVNNRSEKKEMGWRRSRALPYRPSGR